MTPEEKEIVERICGLLEFGDQFYIDAREQDGDNSERLTVSHKGTWFSVEIIFRRGESVGVPAELRPLPPDYWETAQ